MEALNKWLVGLDLTEHDQSILRYTKLLSDALRPESIEFVYVAHRLPDAVHIHLPTSLKYPTYDNLFQRLYQEVRKYFSDDHHISCEILDGPVQFDLWHETWVKEIDLFIAGSKPKHKGRGLFPRKFVRKSFCSVLFIPLEAPESIKKIWVPTDFSDRSGHALQTAIYLSKEMEQHADISLHHVYQLPHAYYYEGFPRFEILMAVKSAAEDKYNSFIKEFNQDNYPVTISYTELSGSYIATDIDLLAVENEADLILMAAGGRSRLSNIFLGSETDQMTQKEIRLPLMIIKKKQNHVKLWDLVNPN